MDQQLKEVILPNPGRGFLTHVFRLPFKLEAGIPVFARWLEIIFACRGPNIIDFFIILALHFGFGGRVG